MTAFKVEVDVSSIGRATKRATDTFRRMPRRLLGIASKAADKLTSGDSYQNRTGSLRNGGVNGPGTQAMLDQASGMAGAEARVTLEMDTEYASYVIARGFSNWDTVMPATEKQLNAECEAIADEAVE